MEQCVRMDVRLILILASQIGDIDFLKRALAAARARREIASHSITSE